MMKVSASLLRTSLCGGLLSLDRARAFNLSLRSSRHARHTAPPLRATNDRGAASPDPASVDPNKIPLLAVADREIPILTYEAWEAQTKALVESIYDGISAPFCCSGTLRVPRPVQVTTVKDKTTYTIQPPPTLFQGDDANVDAAKEMVKNQVELLRDFVAKAPPAVFGKGFDEMYDKTIRNGKQLPADAFATNIDPEVLREVLRLVQTKLGLRVGIQAEPYSINIYEEGGLFESHKDTPRGRDMFGTLVLCLPSLFVGGALQVGMTQGTTHSYFGRHLDQCRVPLVENRSGDPSWWRFDGAANGPVAIPWCAFFSDADHRVRPFRKGVRVVLSYLLRRTDGPSSEELQSPHTLAENGDQASALAKAFRSIRSNAFKPDVRVAFPCDHLYTTWEVFPNRGTSRDPMDIADKGPYHKEGSAKSMNRMTPATIGKLKGRDALVARAASGAGLQVFLLPILNQRDGTQPNPPPGSDYLMSQFEADNLWEIDGYGPSIYDVFDPPVEDFCPYDVADLWIKGHSEGEQERIGAFGTFGNGPCEVDEYYLHAALLLEPLSPRVFRFTSGQLSHDVPVDFSEAQTMRDVISQARGVDPDGNGLFSGSRIASALAAGEKADDGGSPSQWALTFELMDMPDEKELKRSNLSEEEFLGLTPQDIVGTVPMDANPILIAVRLVERSEPEL